MKYSLRSLVVNFVVAAFLIGCNGPASDPSSKVLGKWQVSISGSDGMLAVAGGPPGAAVEEYKDDGTVATTMPTPLKLKMVGTWKFVKAEGGVVVLLVKLPDSPEHERRLEFTDDDHFTLLPDDDATRASKSIKLHYVRIK